MHNQIIKQYLSSLYHIYGVQTLCFYYSAKINLFDGDYVKNITSV